MDSLFLGRLSKQKIARPNRSAGILNEKFMQQNSKFTDHPAVFIGPPMIIFFDLVVPCIIYYSWSNVNKAQWEKRCGDYNATRVLP
jgi:hypothetical protein